MSEDDEIEINLTDWNKTADCWSTPDGGLIVGLELLLEDDEERTLIAVTTDKGGLFMIDANLLLKDL